MSKVYFAKVTSKDKWNEAARKVLETLIEKEQITLEKKVPIKVHTGEPGNVTFIQPKYFDRMIDLLEEQGVETCFMETNMAQGGRDTGEKSRKVAKDHGFTRIPFVVADGEDGFDQVSVPIRGGKHFTECKIASELHKHNQVIVASHFKGHVMTGFGGAIKMLGIGFASARGKTEAHAVPAIPDNEQIDWDKAVIDGNWEAEEVKWDSEYVYHGMPFIERMTEYALAAKKPKHLHILFATNLVKDCDCDGKVMEPLYEDLGIFASTDPVAVDKAILDMLDEREGKATYWGREVFPYAEKVGLGSTEYELVEIKV